MTPQEFATWMSGATAIIGDGNLPTAEQWATINERLAETIGKLVADKMLRDAQPPSYEVLKKYQEEIAKQRHAMQRYGYALSGVSQQLLGTQTATGGYVAVSGSLSGTGSNAVWTADPDCTLEMGETK